MTVLFDQTMVNPNMDFLIDNSGIDPERPNSNKKHFLTEKNVPKRLDHHMNLCSFPGSLGHSNGQNKNM